MAQIKIITKNDVLDNVNATSENPVQSKVLSTALSGKLDKKGYASSLENNVATIVKKGTTGSETYEVDWVAIPAAANADWNQTDTSAVDYIKNKPFKAIGTGLTVKTISDVPTLTADTQFQFKIFTSLPTAAAEYAQTIGLVAKSTSESGNVYDEYACVDTGTSESANWKWELIGSMKASVTQTTTEIKVDGTALQTASTSQIGLLSSADWQTFNGKQAAIPAKTASGAAVVAMSATAGTVSELAVDTTATKDSANLITSGAVHTVTSDKIAYSSGSGDKTFKLGYDSTNGLYIETA